MSQIGEILALDMPFQFSYIRPSGTESLSIEGLKIPPEDNPVRDHHLPLYALRRLIFEADISHGWPCGDLLETSGLITFQALLGPLRYY